MVLCDIECVNVVRGLVVEIYLICDVCVVVFVVVWVYISVVGWGLMGFLIGGYCAMNFVMWYIDMFLVVVFFFGYDCFY